MADLDLTTMSLEEIMEILKVDKMKARFIRAIARGEIDGDIVELPELKVLGKDEE